MTIMLVCREHPLRGRIEAHIQDIFADRYSADVTEFPERLAAIMAADGTPICAAGVRTSRDGFFSESYLDLPAERALAVASRQVVRRKEIIEVSSLASIHAGSAFLLLHAIITVGRKSGNKWGLFTATSVVRRALRVAGMATVELATAAPQAVANPDQWGSYYEHDPVVCALYDCPEEPLQFVPARNVYLTLPVMAPVSRQAPR